MRTATLLGCVTLLLIIGDRLVSAAAPPEVAPPPRVVDPDTAAARSLRWTLRFKVESGKDYIEQVGILGGSILLPIPPENTKAILVPDANKPKERREATEKDLKDFQEHLQFTDERSEAVKSVANALGLDFTPKKFLAVFPKELEAELVRKEAEYRNRRVEDIEQTVFRIVIRGEKAEVVVEEQQVQKR